MTRSSDFLIDKGENQHADLGRHASQRDKAHGHGHAHIEAKPVHQPESADQRKWNGEHHHQGCDDVAEVQIEQQKDNKQGEGHDDPQPFIGPLHILELSGPCERIARRQLDSFADQLSGPGDVTADIAGLDIHIDPCIGTGILRLDRGRSPPGGERRHLRQRYLRTRRGRNQYAAQLFGIIAQFTRITQVDRITLQPLHRLCHIDAADRALDDILHIRDGQTVACDGVTVDVEIEVIAAHGAIAKGGERVRHCFQHQLDFLDAVFQDGQIRPGNLDTDGRLDAGGKHVDARFDRIGPCIGHARETDGLIHFIHQRLRRLVRIGPLIPGFELHGRFQHGQRRRIGRGLDAAHLAEDRFYLGKGFQYPVRLLHEFLGLGDGDAREGRGHVKHVALIQRRHEFTADSGYRIGRSGQQQDGYDQALPAPPDDFVQRRFVDKEQEPVHRVFVLGRNFATDKIAHQNGYQGDGQDSGASHGVGLGERQWRKQPSFLSLKREYRQERHGNNEQ